MVQMQQKQTLLESIQAQIVDPREPVVQRAIWNILVAIDLEFVPPLSARSSTTTAQFGGTSIERETSGPHHYFDEILQQTIILAEKDRQSIGLFSFRPAHWIEPLRERGPCNYVTTVGVMPGFRGMGVARRMYAYALHALPAQYASNLWATRTWSSNTEHIRLLTDLGFQQARVLENHRAPGVDTLYYCLET